MRLGIDRDPRLLLRFVICFYRPPETQIPPHNNKLATLPLPEFHGQSKKEDSQIPDV